MSDLNQITYWYKYNSHVRKRYLKAILALPKEEALKDRGASYLSILDIFVHVLDGYRFFFLKSEDIWRGNTPLDQLKEREREIDNIVMKKINSLSEKDLDQIVLYDFDLRSVLNHMIEEELQHRGELNALFWQMNIEPPISDLEDIKYIKKHLANEKCELCES